MDTKTPSPVATLANVKDQDGGRSSRLRPTGIALGLPLGEHQLFLDAPTPPAPDADELAQFIRSIDGKHELGAGALAEAIVCWLGRREAPAGYDAACNMFTSYFVRNYPGPDTLIHKPEWHAPRLFKAAYYAFQGAAQKDLDLRSSGAVPALNLDDGSFAGDACRLAAQMGVAYNANDSCKLGAPFYAFTVTELTQFAKVITRHASVTYGGAGSRAEPQERAAAQEVARIGDMDQRHALRVGFDGDGDIYLSTTAPPGSGVEFCTTGTGGGKSPNTYNALVALMVAIEADNQQDPKRDWIAKRNAPRES